MKTDRIILKQASLTKDLPYIHQNRGFSQRYTLEKNYQLCKQTVYENRIFHTKKIFILPKESTYINEMKGRVKTLDNQPTKFKPSEGFCKYIDVLQKNKTLLRRGVCQIPIQHLFLSDREKRRMKTEESHKQSITAKDRVKTCISSTRAMCSIKQSQNPEVKQKFSNVQIPKKWSSSEKRCSIEQQFRTLNIQRFGSRSFKNKPTMVKEETIRVRNQINRKLGIQMITYSMLGKRYQWLNN